MGDSPRSAAATTNTKPRLVLYTLPADMGLPISDSPPCAKVEVYLELTGTPYESEVGDTRKSPTKLVPYVRWPDGELQAESSAIIARLDEDIGLDVGIDPARYARGKELAALGEEIIYDACLYDRFMIPEGAKLQHPLTKSLVAHFVPGVLVPLAARYVDYTQRRRSKKTRMADPEEGYAVALGAIEHVVDLLGDGPFLCGAEPCTVDCSLWPLIVHAAATPNRTPLRDAPGRYPALIEWALRFGQRAGCTVERSQLHV